MPHSRKENYLEDQLEHHGLLLNPHEGEKLTIGDTTITFKVTSEMSNDQLGVYEIELSPQAIGAKLHYHRFMDETFIVTAGILTVQLADEVLQAQPGALVHVPRFTPHGFRNDTDQTVKLMLIFNPSQKREGFFRGLLEILNEVPIDPEKYLKLYRKYDSFPVDAAAILPLSVEEG